MDIKLYTFFAVVLAIVLALTACKGPEGPVGPQGTQGEQGPVGPAGEDGSMIYAGENSPSDDIGATGDYYLNSNTGEFYGPKDDGGWGDPIIVMMGEGSVGPQGPQGPQGPSGEDGEDGQDGTDGEDGSQIYSGDGAPDNSLGVSGDYYLDKTNYHLYGPKTGGGWGSPLNLKGADGSDNVTRHIFPGVDFTSTATAQSLIFGVENGDESAWLVYLFDGDWKYFVPGYGTSGTTEYRERHAMGGTTFDSRISRHSGPGEVYSNIYIIQIKPGATEDHTKMAGNRSAIPEDLDVSDYEAVADYYGFK